MAVFLKATGSSGTSANWHFGKEDGSARGQSWRKGQGGRAGRVIAGDRSARHTFCVIYQSASRKIQSSPCCYASHFASQIAGVSSLLRGRQHFEDEEEREGREEREREGESEKERVRKGRSSRSNCPTAPRSLRQVALFACHPDRPPRVRSPAFFALVLLLSFIILFLISTILQLVITYT